MQGSTVHILPMFSVKRGSQDFSISFPALPEAPIWVSLCLCSPWPPCPQHPLSSPDTHVCPLFQEALMCLLGPSGHWGRRGLTLVSLPVSYSSPGFRPGPERLQGPVAGPTPPLTGRSQGPMEEKVCLSAHIWDGTPGLLPAGPWGLLLSPPGNESPPHPPGHGSVNGVGGLLLLIGVREHGLGCKRKMETGGHPRRATSSRVSGEGPERLTHTRHPDGAGAGTTGSYSEL